MDKKQMTDVYDAIEMLEELGLPVGMEKLQERKEMESKYLEENVVPQIQAHAQSLVEQMHLSFCLVVDYKYGESVQVRIAEKTKIKVDEKRSTVKKVTSPKGKSASIYESARIQAEWEKLLESIPKGNTYFKYAITQSYSTLSKLLNTIQSREIRKYILPLFEILNIPTSGRITPTCIINILEPEQFEYENTKEGTVKKIVLWSQVQKVEKQWDGTQKKVFESDGIIPVMIDKTKKIKEGQWSLKILCDLMAQKEYFANLHSSKDNVKPNHNN